MKNLLLACFLILCPTILFAQSGGITHLHVDSLPVNISNNWLYTNVDDSTMAKPGFNDSGWQEVRLGRYTAKNKNEFKGLPTQFSGIGWFRQHVYLDSTLKNTPLAFELQQPFASEIFIDGKLVERYGSIGDKDSTIYFTPNKPKLFTFDTVGHHVIAIHFADFHDKKDVKEGEIVGLNLSIGDANTVVVNTIRINKISNILLSLALGILGMLGIMHLLLWVYRRKEIANLFVAMVFIAIAYSFFLGLKWENSTDPDYSIIGDSVLNILFLVIFWGLSGFLNASFAKLNKRFVVLTTLTVVAVVLGIINIRYYNEVSYAVALIILIEANVIVLKAMKQKIKGSRIIGIQILAISICTMISIPIMVYIDGFGENEVTTLTFVLIATIIILCLFTFLGIPFTISAFLAKRYATLNKDLSKQLLQVQTLSEKTILQEQEKKKILEGQKQQLEKEVIERTKEIIEEKKKSDDLLLNILPAEVAEELKENGKAKAKYFDEVTVLFTDFVDFTQTGERLSAEQLVDELDTCFKAFDEIMGRYGIEKIKTIGDAYMAVCGLPTHMEDHAQKTIYAALDIQTYMRKRQAEHPDTSFRIRIGIHSGNVVAGIVGIKKFAYDIWGDAVNTAARMESNSEPNKINISESTYQLVKDHFKCSYRGEIDAKGKGAMKMYFVD